MELRRALARADVLGITGDPDTEVIGVASDSRRVGSGDLFACVRGEKVDGHRFAPDAIAAGAIALLVEELLDVPVAQARVTSVRRAMALAAHEVYGRPSEAMALVGITGTNGKTTTTFLVEGMTAAAGMNVGLIGSVGAYLRGTAVPVERSTFNTPEAPDLHRILRHMADAGAELVAMEVTSNALRHDRVLGARFAVAGFTNLTRDHLEWHGTMDAYFAAKARLFTPSYTRRAAVMVDDEWGRRLADTAADDGLDVWRVSTGTDGDVAVAAAARRAEGSEVELDTPSGRLHLSVALPGSFNVANAALAAACSLLAGVPPAAVEAGSGALAPGRFERVPVDGGPTVIVDYAHTPDGLDAALTAARELTPAGRRLIAVFGAGGDRDPGKRAPMGVMAGRIADYVIVTSDNPRSEDPGAIAAAVSEGVAETGTPYAVILDRREAIRSAITDANVGDVIVIAGKGHERGQETAGVVTPFDDRVVAAEELERLR